MFTDDEPAFDFPAFDPPEDRSRSSFQQALDGLRDMFEKEEEVGPDADAEVAKVVDGLLRRRPNDVKVKELVERHPRCGNIANLKVPKTNEEALNKVKFGVSVVDASLQRCQRALSAATTITGEFGRKLSFQNWSYANKFLHEVL